MTGGPLYSFFVPGLPIAKGRARSRTMKTKAGKTIATHYTPAATRNFEAVVKDLAAQERQRQIFWLFGTSADGQKIPLHTGPLDLVVEFRFPVPASWPAWRQDKAIHGTVHHTKKPDCSNLVKAIEDACNGVLWKDDGQVVGLVVDKRFAHTPGVQVDVYQRNGISCDDTKDRCLVWQEGRAHTLPLGERIRRATSHEGGSLLP